MSLLYVMLLLVCGRDTCQPVPLPGEGTQQACLHAAPQEAARYAQEHPGITVQGYRCQPAGKDA
jgi:hypothetical protein